MASDPRSSIRPALYEGAFWLLLGSGGQKLLGLLSGAVLARLLYPRDFGVFALSALAYELAGLFSSFGITQYVVSSREEPPSLEAAHRLNLGFATIVAVLLAAGASLFAAFFDEPELRRLVPVLALALPIGAWGAVQGALLERHLRLAAVARRRLVVNLGTVLVTIVLAFLGLGVWALVLPVPLRALAVSALNRRLEPWRPRFRGPAEGAPRVLRYGAHIVGARAATYLSDQMDNAAVGRFLGSASLGLYDFAYQAAMMPLRWAGDLAQRLAFPAIAHEARRRAVPAPAGPGAAATPTAFLQATRWTAYVTGPLVAGLAIVAPDWVAVVYGERWTPAVPLIRVLAPAALVLLLARPAVQWMQASGHEAWPARVRWATIPLFALGLALAVPRGLPAVAQAMAAVLVVQGLAMILAASARGATPLAAWGSAAGRGLLPAAGMLAGLLAASMAFGDRGTPLERLAVAIPLGAGLQLAASFLTSRDQLREILGLVRHGMRRAR